MPDPADSLAPEGLKLRGTLAQALQDRRTLKLDGAMGTELLRRGVATPLPLWSASANVSHPEVVEQIHRDYVRAGCDLITTNTFFVGVYPGLTKEMIRHILDTIDRFMAQLA